MQPGNLLAFTKGGGGLIGKGKVCRLDDFKIVVHQLKSKDGTTYPAATFCQFDVNVLDDGVDDDKRHAVQYLRVGRVPLWYAQQINSMDPKRDSNYPGGYLPSLDNQNPSTAGPFILFDNEQGIWEGEDYSYFLQELVNLKFLEEDGANRMAKQGVACLNGIVVKLDDKAKKKGAKAAATDAAKTVMVPVQVIQWPWNQGQVAVAAAAPAAIAQPKPAVAAAPVAVAAAAPITAAAPTIAQPIAAAAAPAQGNGADYDGIAVKKIQDAAKQAGGMLKREALLTVAFPLTADLDGATRSQVMTRINNPTFVQQQATAGHFLLDPAGTIMVAG